MTMVKSERVFNLLSKVKEYFSRKFLLAFMCLLLGYNLVLQGKDVEGWSILVAVILGFYNGSNVAETYTKLKTGRLVLKQGREEKATDGDSN